MLHAEMNSACSRRKGQNKDEEVAWYGVSDKKAELLLSFH